MILPEYQTRNNLNCGILGGLQGLRTRTREVLEAGEAELRCETRTARTVLSL